MPQSGLTFGSGAAREWHDLAIASLATARLQGDSPGQSLPLPLGAFTVIEVTARNSRFLAAWKIPEHFFFAWVFIFEDTETLLEELALIESAVERPAEVALEAVVRAHTRLVFQIAYGVLRNHHDAEDATQETFLRLMHHDRELGDVHDLKAWVARVAWRIAVNYRRSTPKLEDGNCADEIEQLKSQCAGAEQIVISAQMLRLTERLIANLPPNLRAPMILSTVEELTSAEIAIVLGIPEASVRTRLHRARRLLKEKLSSLLEGKAL